MPIPLRAGGNIAPCRFVKLDTAADNQVLACGSGERPFGISQKGTRRNYPGLDDGYCAIAGEELLVYQIGEDCWLELGATATTGQRIMPSTNGVGTPTTANLDIYGAHASQSGVSGELIEVTVVLGDVSS